MAEDYRDDRQDFEPEASTEEDAGDPAAAFEALRATVEELSADLRREMTTIRKGVEVALDQFERQGTPVDYSADLGRMVQQLATAGERIQAVEQSPAMKNGPEHYARVIETIGERVSGNAVRAIEARGQVLERVSADLRSYVRSAYDRRSQDIRMWTAGGFGLVAGAFLLLLLPRFLPLSADTYVAGLVMGRDRVSAAHAMIQAADPARAGDISTGGWVYETNRATIDKCIKDMFQTQKEQRCTLTLPVVESKSSR